MGSLAVGLAVDFYVVLAKVTQSAFWLTGFSIIAIMTLAGFWFVYPSMARARLRS
jgi:hypothetical protein